MQSQESIGWANFLYGRTSSLWLDAQQEWITQKATKWKYSAKSWSIKMIQGIKEIPWKMWENRNDYLHSTHHHWRLEEETHINDDIHDAFLRSTGVLPRDKHRFQALPTKIIQLDLPQCKQWLQSATAALA